MKPIGQMSQIELATFVQAHLAMRGIPVVLSGGAAVSFYVGNLYVSNDIDLIAEWGLKKAALNRAMGEIGFSEESKYYSHPEAIDLIEILPGPLAVGKQPVEMVHEVQLQTGLLRVLNPSDCVKDRLAAYFYWNDTEALRQAILVSQIKQVNLIEIEKWAAIEGEREKFMDYLGQLGTESG